MISLNYRDSRPIYEQIKEGLKHLIVTGAMKADERLPSVRTLATQLSINPNTIQRAYNELEGEGYIYSVPGKGSFASASVDAGEKRRRELLDQFRTLAAELRFLGVGEAELTALLRAAPETANASGETANASGTAQGAVKTSGSAQGMARAANASGTTPGAAEAPGERADASKSAGSGRREKKEET